MALLKQILKRGLSTGKVLQKFNAPLTANDMLRAGGITSMYRLPIYENTKGKYVKSKSEFGYRYFRLSQVV